MSMKTETLIKSESGFIVGKDLKTNLAITSGYCPVLCLIHESFGNSAAAIFWGHIKQKNMGIAITAYLIYSIPHPETGNRT